MQYVFPADSASVVTSSRQLCFSSKISRFEDRDSLQALLVTVGTSAPGRSLESLGEQLEEGAKRLLLGNLERARYYVRISHFNHPRESQTSCSTVSLLMLSIFLRDGLAGGGMSEAVHVWCSVRRLSLQVGAARVVRRGEVGEVARPLQVLVDRLEEWDTPEDGMDVVWDTGVIRL